MINAVPVCIYVCFSIMLLQSRKHTLAVLGLKYFFFLFILANEEANGIKLQEEMMYIASEHTVAMETLKADQEKAIEDLGRNLDMKHSEEIKLGMERQWNCLETDFV